MKILVVTPAFVPSEFGGIKIQSYYLARELAKRGHEVTVYTSNARNRTVNLDKKGPYQVDGINVVYFNNCLPTRYFPMFYTPGMVKPLREEVSKYDVVHLHGIRTFQSVVTYRYCGQSGVPYVLTVHGSLPQISGWVMPKKIYDYVFGYRVLMEASRVIALTPAEAGQFRQAGITESRIVQSTNGIDLGEFAALPEKGAFRKSHGIKEKRVVLFLGRIHRIKGLDILAEAFAGLLKGGEDARLVITGQDYGYLAQLKRTIKQLDITDKVTVTGFLTGRAKIEAYVDSDVYVVPSIYESFSTTALEAMACGIPVIVTDRCAIADVIGDRAGVVVPYDKEQLQHALQRLLGDDKMRQDLGAKGKLLVRERFNWEKIAEQMEGVYQDVRHSRRILSLS